MTTTTLPNHNNAVLPSERIAAWRIWPVGLLAAVLAAVANALVFVVVVDGFGVASAELDTVVPTLAFSLLGGLGATLVFTIIALRARQPIRTFRLVALAVLFVSFVPDFLAGATAAGIVTLLAMHVVAAAIIVGSLTTLTRKLAILAETQLSTCE